MNHSEFVSFIWGVADLIERPLRLNFQVNPERIGRLDEQTAFSNLAVSKKKEAKARATEEEEGRFKQEEIRRALSEMPKTLFKNRDAFLKALESSAGTAGLKVSAPIRKAILSAVSERDESAEICRDDEGYPEPDPDVRDTENVPLSESTEAFFEREVKPHVPDAWINRAVIDEKDKQAGKVGYEINFNRYFYKYTPPRPLEEIEADIKTVEQEIMAMLREMTK
jgi:type I restriction enzyme M protein